MSSTVRSLQENSQALAVWLLRPFWHPIWVLAIAAAPGVVSGWIGFAAGLATAGLVTGVLIGCRRGDRRIWDAVGGTSTNADCEREISDLRARIGVRRQVLLLVAEANQTRKTGAQTYGWAYPAVVVDGDLWDELAECERQITISHELGHLLYYDRVQRPLIGFVAGGLISAAAVLAIDRWPLEPGVLILWALVVAGVVLLATALHRAIEYRADRVAASAVGDASAFESTVRKAERFARQRLSSSANELPPLLQRHPTPVRRIRAYERHLAPHG